VNAFHEINPRAAAITELVLWIGYLQWHFRTRGRTMSPNATPKPKSKPPQGHNWAKAEMLKAES
jgi:hypothetical protein